MADAETLASPDRLASFEAMLAADDARFAAAEAEPRETTAEVIEVFTRVFLGLGLDRGGVEC